MEECKLTQDQRNVMDHVLGAMREDDEDPEEVIKRRYGGNVGRYCDEMARTLGLCPLSHTKD